MLRTRANTTLDSDDKDSADGSTWDGSLRAQSRAAQPSHPPLTQRNVQGYEVQVPKGEPQGFTSCSPAGTRRRVAGTDSTSHRSSDRNTRQSATCQTSETASLEKLDGLKVLEGRPACAEQKPSWFAVRARLARPQPRPQHPGIAVRPGQAGPVVTSLFFF